MNALTIEQVRPKSPKALVQILRRLAEHNSLDEVRRRRYTELAAIWSELAKQLPDRPPRVVSDIEQLPAKSFVAPPPKRNGRRISEI